MKCPICSEKLLPGLDRCSVCGYRVRARAVSPETAPDARPLRSKPPKRHRGCCSLSLILPALVLLPFLLQLIGGLLFSIGLRLETQHTAVPEPMATAPIPESVPIPTTQEDCFAIESGCVFFLPDRWDGSPILSIPETVNGQTVTAIGPGCFRDCKDLTTIILPETAQRIEADAFAGCAKLRGLYLPFSMESIAEGAFAGCLDLEAICIPASVTSIAPGCFDDCASLLYIIYEGSFESWYALYNEYITPFTTVICLDGSYYHGTPD